MLSTNHEEDQMGEVETDNSLLRFSGLGSCRFGKQHATFFSSQLFCLSFDQVFLFLLPYLLRMPIRCLIVVCYSTSHYKFLDRTPWWLIHFSS
jgi:hypothetical protein